MDALLIKGHSRNNYFLFLPTLAADLQLEGTGLAHNVIGILHSLLRTLDTESRGDAGKQNYKLSHWKKLKFVAFIFGNNV